MIRLSSGLRAVALFEAIKGTLAREDAVELVGRLHLNPGKNYPSVFVRLMENAANTQLWLIAALVVVYALVRFLEAYGLWRSRAWAEWVAAVSGTIYIPFEVYEISRGLSSIKVAALVLNIAIVAYICYALWRSSRNRRATAQ
jgi:uncharacterized membrane protein (DUF2068 family)